MEDDEHEGEEEQQQLQQQQIFHCIEDDNPPLTTRNLVSCLLFSIQAGSRHKRFLGLSASQERWLPPCLVALAGR